MTDQEKLLSFCTRLSLKQVPDMRTLLDDSFCIKENYEAREEWNFPAEGVTCITLGSGLGYGGFFVEFFFDRDGKILKHACWE
jgi:hypothetical protein